MLDSLGWADLAPVWLGRGQGLAEALVPVFDQVICRRGTQLLGGVTMRRANVRAMSLTALVVGAVVAALGLSPATATVPVGPDVAVSVDAPYVKANGRTPGSGDAIAACGQNRRQQNEPSAAVDPRKPSIVVAGSNDYCTVEVAGGTWTGFYRSVNRGATWQDSLLPGYPTDTSPEGLASPLMKRHHQRWRSGSGVGHARTIVLHGERVQSDSSPERVGVDRHLRPRRARYVRTVIVGSGTPALNGRFNDKTAIEVDRGVNSPHNGNVYGAWSLFQGIGGNNSIQFTRSTDHGATFSHAAKISTGSKNVQFADIAVTSNGTVYLAYRQFETRRGHQESEIAYVVQPTVGVRSASRPSPPASSPSMPPTSRGPGGGGGAHEQAYENAEDPNRKRVRNRSAIAEIAFGTLRLSKRVRSRHDSQPRITADPMLSISGSTWSMTLRYLALSKHPRRRTTPRTRPDPPCV